PCVQRSPHPSLKYRQNRPAVPPPKRCWRCACAVAHRHVHLRRSEQIPVLHLPESLPAQCENRRSPWVAPRQRENPEKIAAPSSMGLQEHHCLRRNTFLTTGKTQTLGSGGLDVDLFLRHFEICGDTF